MNCLQVILYAGIIFNSSVFADRYFDMDDSNYNDFISYINKLYSDKVSNHQNTFDDNSGISKAIPKTYEIKGADDSTSAYNLDQDGQCKLSQIPNVANFETEINKHAANIPKGQCTEWADGRYFQLTGKHMDINGDARVWARQAMKEGKYKVSNIPSVPSVAVFQPGMAGSGEYGHVGVVESVSGDGNKFCLSSWNSPGLGKTSTKIVQKEPGMQFIIRL